MSPSEPRPIVPDGGPPATGSYSPAILVGELLFLSGQAPYTATGDLRTDSIEAQVRQTLENLDRVARAAGARLADAVRVGVYLSDLEHFDAMDACYREFFPTRLPARTTIQSSLIGFDVEIDAVVHVPGAR